MPDQGGSPRLFDVVRTIQQEASMCAVVTIFGKSDRDAHLQLDDLLALTAVTERNVM